MKKILTSLFLISLVAGSLISCSHKKDEQASAEISYTKAMKLIKNKNYVEAAEAFTKIDDEFPFSKWAVKAQPLAVYAYYKEENYVKLLQVIDDFLRLNPASEYVPYMMYMKGLTYYNQIPEISRAQDNTQLSSFTFRELIARFPASEYASDASGKLSFIDEHIAGAKMSVGRYQIKVKNFVGAIENFTEVTKRYRLTDQVPEAYFRLAEIYYKVGLRKESVKAYKILQSTYPQSTWVNLAQKIDYDLFTNDDEEYDD